jgi:hypothetical protein
LILGWESPSRVHPGLDTELTATARTGKTRVLKTPGKAATVVLSVSGYYVVATFNIELS